MENSFGDQPTPRREDYLKEGIVSIGEVLTRRQRARLSTGEVLLGRYKILGELGQGGMGLVFRCLDEVSGIEVAVKMLPPEVSRDPDELEEIRSNFQLVSSLVHQNICAVRTLELDPMTGEYYLVMELASGCNLRAWKRRHDPHGIGFDLKQIIGGMRQIASALDYAHSRRVIHRDIKPSNVMIADDGQIKVLDFGLAAQVQSSFSRTTGLQFGTSGTGPYMAPEQWQGQYQDAQTDQYALAVVVYELVAGHVPFDSHDPAVLREAILHSEPVKPEGMNEEAWQYLRCGLAKTREERYASCDELVRALYSTCEHSPVRTTTANHVSTRTSNRSHPSKRTVVMKTPSKRMIERVKAPKKDPTRLIVVGITLLSFLIGGAFLINQSDKARIVRTEAAYQREQMAATAQAQREAETARSAALDAEAHRKLGGTWTQAEGVWREAAALQQSGNNAAAREKYAQAVDLYRSARSHAFAMQTYRDQESRYESDLNRANSRDLDRFGGSAWEDVKKLAEQARQSYLQPREGAELYRQAREDLRRVTRVVSQAKSQEERALSRQQSASNSQFAEQVQPIQVTPPIQYATCSTCEGAGKIACISCKGTGTISERRTAPCLQCDGTGRYTGRMGGTPTTCPFCNGVGIDRRRIITETLPCPACSGERISTCAACRGRGRVEKW